MTTDTPRVRSTALFTTSPTPIITWIDRTIDLHRWANILRSALLFGGPAVRLTLPPLAQAPPPPIINQLTRRVGVARTLELCITGFELTAQEALHYGLIDAICDQTDFETWLAGVHVHSPVSQRLASEMLTIQAVTGNKTAEAAERIGFALSFALSDSEEGIRAFLEKRKPKFLR